MGAANVIDLGIMALNPGATSSGWWNNSLKDAVYVLDVVPVATAVDVPAQIEVLRTWNVDNWTSDGKHEREFHWTIKNVGANAVSCKKLLAYLTS